MKTTLKLLLVAGARPNFMKVAPIIKAARLRAGSPKIEIRLVHTGQHYDAKMSDVFFRELGIPAPDVNLEVGSGSHAVQTANIMIGFEPVCLAEKPDWVVVVGDVNSTLACTLVAVKMGIRVAHVEAGLRSFDRTMPEELNRILTDSVADLLLTPSEDANENLVKEGIARDRIHAVGNIMIDSLVENLPGARASKILSTLGLTAGKYIFVTLHRPQNVDHRESLSAIICEFRRLSSDFPVVFPMHPRTKKRLEEFGIEIPEKSNIHVIDPVGYHDSLNLTENARIVLTDSGGLQEESTYFRTPCLTLRPNTERPVTITMGSNQLTSVATLTKDFDATLRAPARKGVNPPLWDGKTADRIIDKLIQA